MQFTLIVSVLTFAASALAVQITSPAMGSSLDLAKDNTIQWNTVSTDPSTANIVLVNNAVSPPVSIQIAQNVQLSSGSYDLKALKNPPSAGPGYQINLLSTSPENQGILAQSAQFSVTLANDSPTSASFSSSTPSTSMSSTSSGSTITTGSTTGSTTMTTSTTSGSSSSGASTAGSSTKASGSSGSATATPAKSSGGASTLQVFGGAGALLMGVAALVV